MIVTLNKTQAAHNVTCGCNRFMLCVLKLLTSEGNVFMSKAAP